jgi:hypothetical protein
MPNFASTLAALPQGYGHTPFFLSTHIDMMLYPMRVLPLFREGDAWAPSWHTFDYFFQQWVVAVLGLAMCTLLAVSKGGRVAFKAVSELLGLL